MDFDEYEYLEKMVEGSEGEKSKATVNGGDESGKSRDRERRRSSKHRSEDYDDLDHRDKRSKNGDDAHHSDRHKEKGLSSHRSRSSDVDRSERERDRHRSSKEHRDRDKEKDEKNGKEHDRDRRRDRDRDRDRSDREREKKEKVREPDQDRDKERELEHDRDRRSRSQSGRHRDDREPSRDRDFKERDFKSRDNRHRKDKKDEASEPEADPERDQRTVFAFQLPLRADERDIYEFFSRAGKVRDVRLIMDRNSRRSKGVGYIEFYDVMSVPMAIALSGQPLLGHPIMVKPSEAEKNLAQSTSTAAGTVGASAGGGRKLYVGNLHYNITEEQLRQVFESFGAVELVQMPLDETGHCKGFGFVQFSRLEDAKAAQTLNGQLEIAGRTIKVSAVTDQAGGAQDGSKSAGDLDDDEGGGLSLNAQSRALLMAKLDRSGTATSLTGSMGPGIVNDPGASASVLGVSSMVSPLAAPLMQGSVPILGGLASMPVPPVTMPTMDTIGVPSECLMLNNMFDPSLEAEPDFDLDIKEDVQNECAKFGALKHIYVDKNSAGHVYLRFDSAQAAIKAQSALHGRWFAGKMITAVFMVPQNYEAKFPESG